MAEKKKRYLEVKPTIQSASAMSFYDDIDAEKVDEIYAGFLKWNQCCDSWEEYLQDTEIFTKPEKIKV